MPSGKTWPTPSRSRRRLRQADRSGNTPSPPRRPPRQRTGRTGPPAAMDRLRPRPRHRGGTGPVVAALTRAAPLRPRPDAALSSPLRLATRLLRPRLQGPRTMASMATTMTMTPPPLPRPCPPRAPQRITMTEPVRSSRRRSAGRSAGQFTRRRPWRHPASTRPSSPRWRAGPWTRPSLAGASFSAR